jgi:stearoyl-CoA desaturase (delta-9 desaturase)
LAGHGGNRRRVKKTRWEFDDKSYALNQYFYGYLASEWHDNHHKYPFSANNGFLPRQFDLAFQIIKLMHKVGIVESYVDAKPAFAKECLGLTVRA